MPRETLLSRENIGLLLGFIGVVIFGATLPMTRLAVLGEAGGGAPGQGLDPWFVTTGRATVAGLIALSVLLLARRRIPDLATLRTLSVASVCLVFGFPGLTGLAMQTVPAAHGGVVLGILPLVTAMIGSILIGERPSKAFWACAVLGAAVVVGFVAKDGGHIARGDIYLLLATFVTALGYVLAAKVTKRLPAWEVISWQLVIALPVTLPLALWLMPAAPAAVSPSAWAGFVYVSIMSQYVGFFAWNGGLAMGGVARVSQVQLLQTFVTLAVAAAIVGEQVDLATWAVAAIVVGIVLAGRLAAVRKPA